MREGVKEAIRDYLESEFQVSLLLSGLAETEARRGRLLGRFGADVLAAMDGGLGAAAVELARELEGRPEEVEAGREEMVAAVGALRELAGRGVEPAGLQRLVAQAAPRYGQRAWMHRYLHQHVPDRITGGATAAELDAHLVRIGLDVGGPGLYARDARIVAFWSELPVVSGLPPQLRYRLGEPPLCEALERALERRGVMTIGAQAEEEEGLGDDRPRYGGRVGLRDLDSPRGVERVEQRISQRMARFFGEGVGGGGEEEAGAVWEARLVLQNGRPMLLAGPLGGLPSFVRELEVYAGETAWRVLASNLRAQRFAVAVAPSTAAYEWRAVGFEDELTENLAVLRIEGLAAGRATAFRMGAGGPGQVLRGTALSAGQRYGLVLPPGVRDAGLLEERTDLGRGWQSGMVTLPLQVPLGARTALAELGLTVSPSTLVAAWAGAPPRVYRTGWNGDRYPCFTPGDRPTVTVGRAGLLGTVVAFGRGPAGISRLEVPAEGDGLLVLEGLEAGNHMIEILAQETSVEAVCLPFAVAEEEPARSAGVRVQVGETELGGEGESVWTGDGTALGEEALPLVVMAPPLWPVTVKWRGMRRMRLGRLHADERGVVDVSAAMAATRGDRTRTRQGDLLLDFGELGRVALRHVRPADEPELRATLSALHKERGALVAQALGQYGLLRGTWLDPVCEALGYRVRDLAPAELPEPPPGFAGAVLDVMERQEDHLVLRPAAGLVVVPPDVDWRASGPATARGFASRLCRRHKVRRALLTDGLRWAALTTHVRLMPVSNLETVLTGPPELMESFLVTFLAEAQS